MRDGLVHKIIRWYKRPNKNAIADLVESLIVIIPVVFLSEKLGLRIFGHNYDFVFGVSLLGWIVLILIWFLIGAIIGWVRGRRRDK